MSQPRRLQFSVRWLFVATPVAAVVAALAARIEAPRFARGIIGAYFIVWATYLTFNLFRMIRVIGEGRRRLEQIRHRRRLATDRHREEEGTRRQGIGDEGRGTRSSSP
jgi:hypothetical protein